MTVSLLAYLCRVLGEMNAALEPIVKVSFAPTSGQNLNFETSALTSFFIIDQIPIQIIATCTQHKKMNQNLENKISLYRWKTVKTSFLIVYYVKFFPWKERIKRCRYFLSLQQIPTTPNSDTT